MSFSESVSGVILGLGPWLSLKTNLQSLALALRLKSLLYHWHWQGSVMHPLSLRRHN